MRILPALVLVATIPALLYEKPVISPLSSTTRVVWATEKRVGSPVPTPTPQATIEPSIREHGESQSRTDEIKTQDQEVDALVDFYSEKYTPNKYEKSIMKAKLHFLLSKESKHGLDKNHGDNGKAGGPLQFHEPTYIGYRKIMIKRGLTDYIGSRYDYKDAIETTAWAISDGRESSWGPIMRGEIKI